MSDHSPLQRRQVVVFKNAGTKYSWAVFVGDRRLSPIWYCDKHDALKEAKAWVSSWTWELKIDE